MTQRTSRVILNRRTINGIYLAAGDGMFEVAKAVIVAGEQTAPDAPPYGAGLVEGGGALAWVNRKKVAGTTIGGKQIKKPRKVRLDQDVFAVAGWGFPGRLVQWGTVRNPANPFFTRAVAMVMPKALGIARKTMAYRIARLR